MRRNTLAHWATASGVAGLLAVGIGAGCGGGSSSPSPTTPSPSPGDVPTVTITSQGLDPRELRINVGQRVRFVNNDTQARHIQSAPHPDHTDCPATNQLPVLNSGQNGMTGAFSQARDCRYHDHLTEDMDERFRGRILVGGAQPDPGGPY